MVELFEVAAGFLVRVFKVFSPDGWFQQRFVEQILSIVDVPVSNSDKFQQILPFDESVPDSVHRESVDLPVVQQCTLCRRPWRSHSSWVTSL